MPAQQPQRGALATISDAASYLGVPRAAIRRAIKANEIAAFRLGGKLRLRWRDLEEIAGTWAHGMVEWSDNGND